MKKALLTGITGQDGSYLADLLLEKDYEVHGIIRRASTFNTSRIDHLYTDPHVNGVRLFLHYGDLSDAPQSSPDSSTAWGPDEIYHLGAQSHVRVSFDIPENTGDVTALGTIRILEAIREARVQAKFYQASSSEMFGKVQAVPQTEKTPFWPRSPYAVAKVYAYWATVNYRQRATDCNTPAMAFSATMKARDARRKLSLPAKSPAPSRRSKKVNRRTFSSATWTPSATGVLRPSTWRACGGCSSSRKPTITPGHQRNPQRPPIRGLRPSATSA